LIKFTEETSYLDSSHSLRTTAWLISWSLAAYIKDTSPSSTISTSSAKSSLPLESDSVSSDLYRLENSSILSSSLSTHLRRSGDGATSLSQCLGRAYF